METESVSIGAFSSSYKGCSASLSSLTLSASPEAPHDPLSETFPALHCQSLCLLSVPRLSCLDHCRISQLLPDSTLLLLPSGHSPFLKYPRLLKNTHGSALPSASTPSLQVTLTASSPFPLSDHVGVLLSGALFHKHTRPFPARCLAHAVPSVCVPFPTLSTQGTPNSSFQAQPACPSKTPQHSPVESLCPHSCTMAPAAGLWSVGHWLPP